MRLSIIVPVYNVEKYLERCVQTIVAQGLADYEVILVDDGSTDGSGVLCDELQRRYENVRVIHQTNGGLSAARNAGIEVAEGEYITFVDSDDELCPDTLKGNLEFLIAHPQVDMLEYPVEVHADSPQSYMLSFADETLQTDIFADWVRRGGYTHCYAWNKIYRAALWRGIRFPVGEYFEDVAVMPAIVRRCQCIHYASRGCYRYVMHPGTITTSYRYDKQRQLFLNNHRLYMEVKGNPAMGFEPVRLWIGCLNLLIDMGRCHDVDRGGYADMLDMAGRYRPSCKALLVAAPDAATRVKLLPMFVVGLRFYCRLYVALTQTLQP